jgi:hypothetical protein
MKDKEDHQMRKGFDLEKPFGKIREDFNGPFRNRGDPESFGDRFCGFIGGMKQADRGKLIFHTGNHP